MIRGRRKDFRGRRKEEGEYSKHRIVLGMAEGGVDLGDF